MLEEASKYPATPAFFGFMGASMALVFASKTTNVNRICKLNELNTHNISLYLIFFSFYFYIDVGAAYGTYRAGVGIGSIGVLRPELIMRSIIPVVMAGILGIYGMIVSVILVQKGTKIKMNDVL